MAQEVPAGLLDLGQVLSRRDVMVDVMGLVVDYMAPKPTRGGTDWTCTFNIVDLFSRTEGVRVRFFTPASNLPEIHGIGDVVLLRTVKVANYQGADLLLSNRSTSWAIFHSNDLLGAQISDLLKLDYRKSKGSCSLRKLPTKEEILYAIQLCKTGDPSTFTQFSHSAHTVGSVRPNPVLVTRDKYSLLKDVRPDKFFDIIGQVVKSFTSGDRHDLHLTDYTTNSSFYNHVNPDIDDPEHSKEVNEYNYLSVVPKTKWKGPWGQQTIIVTLFHPHANFAMAKVKDGDFVLLQNVHIKHSREQTLKLEGVLHEDKKYPEKINISMVTANTDDRVKSILRRKKEYESQLKNDEKDTDFSQAKRKAYEGEQKVSKAQKRRMKERTRTEMAAPVKAGAGGGFEARSATSKAGQLPVIDRTALRAAYLRPNENIRAMHSSQPSVILSSILGHNETHSWTTPGGNQCTLPFQNVCYRSTVRVVDFKPNHLEDFAVKRRISEYEDLSDYEDDIDEDDASAWSEGSSYPEDSQGDEGGANGGGQINARHKWTWRFALLLEDASNATPKTRHDRLIVYVNGDDADFLLNMEACNLRRSSRALNKLREKLFILWGELEESKLCLASPQNYSAKSNRHLSLKEREEATKINDDDNQGQTMEQASELKYQDHPRNSPSTRAFSCCIMEYGVKIDALWHRRFKMFGTSILS